MKYLITIFTMLAAIHVIYAQGGTCTIIVNGKTIASNKPTETETPAAGSIAASSLKKKNTFKFNVKEKSPQADWHRVFIMMDKNGQELGRFTQKTTSGNFTIVTDFAKPVKGDTIKIKTMLEPNDENVAATIRLRTFPLIDILVK